MAIIENVTIESIDPVTVRASWTGTVGQLAWVFVNGERITGPLDFSSTARDLDLPIAPEETEHIEVHEVPAGVNAVQVNIIPRLNPVIRWWPQPGETPVSYRIFHQEFGEAELPIETIQHVPGQTSYNWRVRLPVNGEFGVWHFFRVEAVQANGLETTTETFVEFVKDIPPSPADVAVTGSGSGNVKITLTV